MNNPTLSIIIRSKNEGQTLPRLLKFISAQNYKDYELILVDNNSTDDTVHIAKQHKAKIINIEKFTHAKACNLGIENSTGKFIYLTNAHSLPVFENIFSENVQILQLNSKIIGTFGMEYPYSDANSFEILRYAYLKERYGMNKPKIINYYNKATYPILNTVSTIIRGAILRKYKYNEHFQNGGEDYLFALELLKKGYEVAYIPSMNVYHSHGGSFLNGLQRQVKYIKLSREAKNYVT